MKKIFISLILIFLFVIFAGCGSHIGSAPIDDTSSQVLPTESEEIAYIPESTDDVFLVALKRSVLRRIKDNSSGQVDRSTLVDTEIELLQWFEHETFHDSRLGELAKQYINGLSLQKEALHEEARSDDQVKWQEGYVERCTALKTLHKEYGFLAEHSEFVATYLASYDDEVELLNVYRAVEADLSAQFGSPDFRMSKKGYFVSFELVNHTEYTFSTAFEMLYQYENNLPAESTTTYIEDIAPGEKYTVSLYCSRLDAVEYTEFDNYYMDAQTRY